MVNPLAPGGKLGCQRQKRFLLASIRARSSGCPAPTAGGITCELPEGRSLFAVSFVLLWAKGGGCLGPSRGLPGTMRQLEGPGCCCTSGLGWEWPGRRHFPGVGVWGFVENCCSAWDETSSRWPRPCPCVGHYHIRRPIKQRETENHWRWWWWYRCFKG